MTQDQDTTLEQLLRAHNIQYDISDIHDIVDRVNAGGFPAHRDDWMDLIIDSESRSPHLSEKLRDLRASRPLEDYYSLSAPNKAVALAELKQDLQKRGIDYLLLQIGNPAFPEGEPPHEQRLAWVSGFTGSEGYAVIPVDENTTPIFLTDSRYDGQAQDEVGAQYDVHISSNYEDIVGKVDREWKVLKHILAQNILQSGTTLACDGRMHDAAECDELAEHVQANGGELQILTDNPVDALWDNKPPEPLAPVSPYDLAYSGESHADKRARMAEAVSDKGADVTFLGMPESVGWLLNIRGFDSPCMPFPNSAALLASDGQVTVFLDTQATTPDLRDHLGDEVTIRDLGELDTALQSLGQNGAKVALDRDRTQHYIEQHIQKSGAAVTDMVDPCMAAKAIKNETEMANIRNAHRKDGLAFTRFLWRLESEIATGGTPDELELVDRLEEERCRFDDYWGQSFGTISCFGANAAKPHHQPANDADSAFVNNSFYLVDAGGHYSDGTTDMTRTVAIGEITQQMRAYYTHVLKANIALANNAFSPDATQQTLGQPGTQEMMEKAGLDKMPHGIGHGVGMFGCVHESPPSISHAAREKCVSPGMFFSNEPGHYVQDAYGIRIENLQHLYRAEDDFLELETVSLAPIDLRAVEPEMLTQPEIAWVNSYHDKVRADLTAMIDPERDAEFYNWLQAKTRPFHEQVRDFRLDRPRTGTQPSPG